MCIRDSIDDTLHVQTGDPAGVLGGLTLGVGEVGRHGDDRLGDGLAQIGLGDVYKRQDIATPLFFLEFVWYTTSKQ